MTNEEKYRKALEMIVNSEEHEGDSFVCDFQTLQGVARQALAQKSSSEFQTPDCPDCACVQDGQCLCIPSKPAAVVELTDDDVIRFAQTVKFKGRFVEAMRDVLAFAKQSGGTA